MSCLPELTLSMHADRALEAADAAAAEAHLAACPTCRARLEALRGEALLINAALVHEVDVVDVPAFARPSSVAPLGAAGALAVFVAGVVAAAPSALDFSLPAPLAWLNPFSDGEAVDLLVHVAMFLAQRGGALMTSIRDIAATAVILAFVGWLTIALGRYRQGHLLLVSLLCVIVALPATSHALEIRRNENGNVLVPAGEKVDDTLIALGDTIEVDGDVAGDLIAFGRRVSIRGRVGGQVFTAGQTLTITGEVDGSVLGAGETVEVSAPRIGRNLYGFGHTVSAGRDTHIEANAVVAAQRASLSGPVGRDVLGFGEEIELGGTIGRSVTAYADRLTMLAPARIGGDLTVHVPAKDHLTISPGAHVAGKVDTQLPEPGEHRSEYATGGFYVGQLLRFAAAFLVGVILLALAPGLRRISLDGATQTLVAGGVGLVALVAVPIIAVLVAITIIGIPIALLGILLWLVGLYLAKIVLAHFIGARLTLATGLRRHFAVALALGLAVVMVAVNLPFIGHVLSFLLTACGLGVLVLFVWDAFRSEPDLEDYAS